MIPFDEDNPFPIIAGRGFSYEDEKQHAAKVDAWLGLRSEEIEMRLRNSDLVGDSDREYWIGKSVQTFSTPYTELRAILEEIKPAIGETIADLGAGYGRLAHVMARHFPESRFLGYEMVEERQAEGQRVIESQRLRNAQLVQADVSRLDFSEMDTAAYFLYDFGSRQDVETCLDRMKLRAANGPIIVVARGGRSRDIIEKHHPWLSQVVKPVHRDHYSIYRTHA